MDGDGDAVLLRGVSETDPTGPLRYLLHYLPDLSVLESSEFRQHPVNIARRNVEVGGQNEPNPGEARTGWLQNSFHPPIDL